MARISLMDICDGIAAAFHGLVVTLNAGSPAVPIIAQSYDNLTEGQQDCPTIQVYPTDSLVDSQNETDRTTFKGCMKNGWYIFPVRGFARQRSHLGEDMEAAVRMWDACEAILEEEGTDCAASTGACTFFGVPGIRNIRWSGRCPATWNYGGVDYAGFELTIELEVF
jgi:hypothetical protein